MGAATGRVGGARGSLACPVHGLRRPRRARACSRPPRCGGAKVRRWVRHSVRCWSHATEGAHRRGTSPAHGPSSGCCAPRRVLPTRRGAPAGGQGSGELGAPGCGPHGVGARACGRRPSAEHPGDHVRAEGAAGDGHRAARGPRWACSSARASATRPEMPQVSGEGSKMSQHSLAGPGAPGFTWAPRVRGRLPRIAPTPRIHPACTSRSQSGVVVLGFGERPPAAP